MCIGQNMVGKSEKMPLFLSHMDIIMMDFQMDTGDERLVSYDGGEHY